MEFFQEVRRLYHPYHHCVGGRHPNCSKTDFVIDYVTLGTGGRVVSALDFQCQQLSYEAWVRFLGESWGSRLVRRSRVLRQGRSLAISSYSDCPQRRTWVAEGSQGMTGSLPRLSPGEVDHANVGSPMGGEARPKGRQFPTFPWVQIPLLDSFGGCFRQGNAGLPAGP